MRNKLGKFGDNKALVPRQGTYVKIGDNDTVMRFDLLENGIQSTKSSSGMMRVKNSTGYLLEFPVQINNGQVSVDFGNTDIQKLPVGQYQFEIVVNDDEKQSVYPDDGFGRFTITKNAKSVDGNMVTGVYVDTFEKKIMDQVRALVGNGSTSGKPQPGSKSDNSQSSLSDSTSTSTSVSTSTSSSIVSSAATSASVSTLDSTLASQEARISAAASTSMSLSLSTVSSDSKSTYNSSSIIASDSASVSVSSSLSESDSTNLSTSQSVAMSDSVSVNDSRSDSYSASQSSSASTQISENSHASEIASISASASVASSVSESNYLDKYRPGLRLIETDKASYTPGDIINITATPNDDHGQMLVEVLNNQDVVASDMVHFRNGKLTHAVILPNDDNKQYLIRVNDKTIEDAGVETTHTAINVVSRPGLFPIMGFISKYGSDITAEQRKSVVDRFKRLHINMVQFYDYYSANEKPIEFGDDGKPLSTWKDIANREVSLETITGYLSLMDGIGISRMAYFLMYGAGNNLYQNGLTLNSYLYWKPTYEKNSSNVYGTNKLPDTWKTQWIYIMNYLNSESKNIVFNNLIQTFKALNFDGLHIDTLGKFDGKVAIYGANSGYAWDEPTARSGYRTWPLSAKKSLGQSMTMGVNAVSSYGQAEISQANLDYNYSEQWPYQDGSYQGLFKSILALRAIDDRNGFIIPAYIHYKAPDGSPYFNTDGVKMLNNTIIAAGATHLELGEHMLHKEYFPNDSMEMKQDLIDYLPKQYDFMVAYHELLRIMNPVDDINVSISNWHNVFGNGQYTVVENSNDKYTVASILNTKGLTTDQWVDNSLSQKFGSGETNITAYFKITQAKEVYWATPEEPEPHKIEVGADGKFTIPYVTNYTLVWAVK